MSAPARLHSVPPSFADAFGHRQLVFDQTAGTSLEVLKFADRFAKSPEFETAMRERIDAMKGVSHPSLGTVHRVERDGESLLLLSKHTPGRRVVELQAKAQGATFALELIRLVTPLVATLEKSGKGISHGAISADRIVVTRDGRLVVVEHVLGSAINSLKLSRQELAELGLVVPPPLPGANPAQLVLDSRADMSQVAFLALSLLLGRPLDASDYPDKIGGLLDEFVMAAESPMLAAKLRSWLERAMQLSPRSFATAAEANDACKDLPEDLEVRIGNSLSAFPSEAVTAARPAPKAGDRSAAPAPKPVQREMPASSEPIEPTNERRRRPLAAWLIAALAVVAIVEGVALFVWPWANPWAGTAGVTAAATVPPPAPTVEPDPATVTPPATSVADATTLAPTQQPASTVAPSAPPPAAAAATIPVKTEAPPSAAPANPDAAAVPAGPRFGGLTVSSPLELKVYENGKLLGTNYGQVAVNEGSHVLEFVNEPTGFRYTQTVNVRAGRMTNVAIAVPSGKLSINAVPWAEVLIDGSAAGQTPLANVTLPIGPHEIVFRHPQLGERKQTVVVKVDGPNKVTQTFSGGGSQ